MFSWQSFDQMLIWSSGQKLNEMATSFLVEFQFLLFKKGCWVTFETCLGVSPIIKDAHICLVSCLVRFWTRLEHTCYYWLIFYFILILCFFLTRPEESQTFLSWLFFCYFTELYYTTCIITECCCCCCGALFKWGEMVTRTLTRGWSL